MILPPGDELKDDIGNDGKEQGICQATHQGDLAQTVAMLVMVAAASLQLTHIPGLPAAHVLEPPGSAAVGIFCDFTCSNPFIAHVFYFTTGPGAPSRVNVYIMPELAMSFDAVSVFFWKRHRFAGRRGILILLFLLNFICRKQYPFSQCPAVLGRTVVVDNDC